MCCLPVWLTMGPMGVCTPWAGKKAGGAAVAGCRAGLRARLLLCLKMIGSFEDPIAAAAAAAIGHGRLGRGRQRRRCRRRRQWAMQRARKISSSLLCRRHRRRRPSPSPSFVRRSSQVIYPAHVQNIPGSMAVHAPSCRTNERGGVEREGITADATHQQCACRARYVLWASLSIGFLLVPSHPCRPLFGLEPSLVRAEVVMLSACYVAKRQEKRFSIRSQIWSWGFWVHLRRPRQTD